MRHLSVEGLLNDTVFSRSPFSGQRWAIWLLALIGFIFLLLPWPLLDKLWAVAYGLCPQRPGHSLFFGGVQMPIEAREGGMFAGFILGAAYLLLLGRGKAINLPSRKAFVILASFITLMGLDGLNAFAYDLYLPTPYTPNLYLRLGTGLLTGLALAGLLIPSFNQTIWQQGREVASFTSWRDVGGVVVWTTLFWGAGLSGFGWLLYPISIIAIFGQVALLTTIGTMVATIVLRREGQAERLADVIPLLLLGFLIIVAGLSATSAVRYMLFGPGPIPAFR